MSPDGTASTNCWAEPPDSFRCNRKATTDIGLCRPCRDRLRTVQARRPSLTRVDMRNREPAWADVAAELWDMLWRRR